ncbi:MAG: cbiG [Clostridia bacterium]|jgi:cobalt-precorrin 5A hydrolase|nr:cbiG [Clostridia bacterium]
MRTAVIALTLGGSKLAAKLAETTGAHLYLPEKFCSDKNKCYPIKSKLLELMETIFYQYDALVFIMAAGIVVRTIAPFIKDKRTDPAVVVMDEKGTNVISLLSGHLGGANQLTLEIARITGANPVITTASDVNNTLAVDLFAQRLGCGIENDQFLTAVTAAIVNGKKVAFYSEYDNFFDLPDNVISVDSITGIDSTYGGAIFLTHYIFEDYSIPSVYLRPKSIILGIGCRRGTTKQKIAEAVKECLEDLHISKKCIQHIATVDVKQDEQGLVRFAQELQVPLKIIARKDIQKIEYQFECSQFVKDTIGVGCAAEPAAILSGKNARLIGSKYKKDGVTVAVAAERELREVCK